MEYPEIPLFNKRGEPVDVKKFNAAWDKFMNCKHTNVQQFTEYCFDCGYGDYSDGPNPLDF